MKFWGGSGKKDWERPAYDMHYEGFRHDISFVLQQGSNYEKIEVQNLRSLLSLVFKAAYTTAAETVTTLMHLVHLSLQRDILHTAIRRRQISWLGLLRIPPTLNQMERSAAVLAARDVIVPN